MKAREKKIARVVSLAASEERRYGEQAGRSQQTLNEQVDKLAELNAYRQSYVSRNARDTAVQPAHWHDYQSFLQRLDAALRSQQQIVRDSEFDLQAHRERWLAKRQKLESLERVLSRCEEQNQRHQSRLEQKQLDDLPQPRTGYDDNVGD